MTKTFFVTGANGFIGQTLVTFLAEQGHQVYALLRPESLLSFGLSDQIHLCYGDLRDPKSLLSAMPNNAYVINLAANPYHRTLSHDVNVVGTQNLVDASKKKHAVKFVQISSQATKIRTKGVYANTKLAADNIVKESGLKHVIIKPSLVFGPGEKGLFSKIAKMASKLPFIPVFGNGQTKLYPIHVRDLSKLIEHVALDSTAHAMTFDAGGKTSITYEQLYEEIAKFVPNHPFLLHIPTHIGLLMTSVLSILPNPPIVSDNVLGSTQDTQCHPLPLLRRYACSPIAFKDGIQEVFAPKKLHVAIVGLGKMGMLHATILNTFKEVEIVALIDTNPKLVGTFKSMGIAGSFFTSLEDAIKETAIDAIYITTPTFAHFKLLAMAMKKNIHTFIEKPVTLNAEEARMLRKMKTNAVIRAGYTLLYHRPFQELHRIISGKRYGKLKSYTATFEHGEVFAPKKGWMFVKKLAGGGVLMNPGPHLFSLLSYNFGKPRSVTGTVTRLHSTEVDDVAELTFSYPLLKGRASLSWSAPKKEIAQYSISCVFERASVTATNSNITVMQKGKKKTLAFMDIQQDVENTYTINPQAYGEAYYVENLDFVQSIKDGKKLSPNTLTAALQTEEIIFQAYKGARE